MKNPLTPAGIEPATFRFVAQHLNHCATAVPYVYIYTHTHLFPPPPPRINDFPSNLEHFMSGLCSHPMRLADLCSEENRQAVCRLPLILILWFSPWMCKWCAGVVTAIKLPSSKGNMSSGWKWNLSHSASRKSGNFCLFGMLSCVSLGLLWQWLFAVFWKGWDASSPRSLYLFLSFLLVSLPVCLVFSFSQVSSFSPQLFPILFRLLLLNPILLHLFSFIHLSVIKIPFTVLR